MPRCNHRSWILVVLQCCMLVEVYSFTCYFPCNRTRCEAVRPESCPYGLVNDTCLCCTVCGYGPGQECSDEIGFCGRGLECFQNVPDGLPEHARLFFPGICRVPPNPPTSASVSTSTRAGNIVITTQTARTTSVGETTEYSRQTTSIATRPGVARTTPAVVPTESTNCRYPTCSIEYCTGSSRRRICSAKELVHTRVASRGYCQYTSCRACFLYTRPPCTTTCSDLPMKPCLKRYDKCVDNYLLSSANSSIIRLTDPRISSYSGRIICHVPGVSHT